MKKLFLFIPLLWMWGCWSGPAVNPYFDFNQVGVIELIPISDHSYMPGSGEMVQSSLTYNFLKYGFDVNESNTLGTKINVGNGGRTLALSCVITEFTDSEIIVVPYRYEERGSTKTTVNLSSETDADSDKAETSTSTSTTTDGGSLREGSRIDYTRARVGIILKMRDKDSGSLVWSNSYWYSGLELHRTTEVCIRNGVNQVRKLFQ